jgi:Family of unknown function (DUF6114)
VTGFMRDGDDPAGRGPADSRQVAVDPDDYGIQAAGPWQRWRRSRPSWGGLLVLLAGSEMLLSERAPLPVVIHVGMQGLTGYLVPAVLLLCGLLVLFSPAQRTFYSILAVLLSLGSWVTSNLGGFFVGMALGVVGGSLAFAWTRINVIEPEAYPELTPAQEPAAGLDAILSSPDESSPVAEEPATRERSADEDTKPIRDEPPLPQKPAIRDRPPLPDEPPIRIDVPIADEPPIRIDVPSPDEPQMRQDAEAVEHQTGDDKAGDQAVSRPDRPAPDQTAPDQRPPGSGGAAKRVWPAGPLGLALLAAVAHPANVPGASGHFGSAASLPASASASARPALRHIPTLALSPSLDPGPSDADSPRADGLHA